jgi:hypothetical protein
VLWIRIRIDSGFNGVPGSGSESWREKMTHKKKEKVSTFFFFEVLDVLF